MFLYGISVYIVLVVGLFLGVNMVKDDYYLNVFMFGMVLLIFCYFFFLGFVYLGKKFVLLGFIIVGLY